MDGFHLQILRVYGDDRPVLNGERVRRVDLGKILVDAYRSDAHKTLYVSLEAVFMKISFM